jgi:hypothetical protein
MPAADPALVKSYQDLLRLLDQQGVPHQTDASTKSVSISTERNGISGVQLIRWQDEDGVLQFIQSLPIEVPETQFGVVESAIARLNHGLAWPGLDLNYELRMLAYRLVAPILPRGSLQPREVQAYFELALKLATDLCPTLSRVVSGETKPADVVADAQKEFARAAAAAPAAPAPEKPSPPVATPPTLFRVD